MNPYDCGPGSHMSAFIATFSSFSYHSVLIQEKQTFNKVSEWNAFFVFLILLLVCCLVFSHKGYIQRFVFTHHLIGVELVLYTNRNAKVKIVFILHIEF